MKKTFITLALLVGILGNSNASEIHSKAIEPKKVSSAKDNSNEVEDIAYMWEVKTTKTRITGTSKSYFEAKREIQALTKNHTVMSKRITPVYVDKSEINKVYIWEIKTNKGYARGVATTESEARKAVKLMSTGSVTSSRIIESFEIKKEDEL